MHDGIPPPEQTPPRTRPTPGMARNHEAGTFVNSTVKLPNPVRAGTSTDQSKAATPVKSTSAVKPAVVKAIVLY